MRPQVNLAPRLPLEDLYSAVAEDGAAALAVAGTTNGLVVEWANDAALELLGLTAEELIGAGLVRQDARSVDGLTHWTAIVADLITAPSRSPLEVGRRTDGHWVDAATVGPGRSLWPVQVSVRPVSGRLWAIWLRSATESQQRAVAAQRDAEHRFRALAEQAPVGIFVSEAGLRLSFVNARYGEIVGVDPTRLTGIRWLHTVHPDDLPVLLSAIDEVLAGKARELNIRLLNTTGGDDATRAAHWAQMRLAPVTAARSSAGFIGTVEDVTDRRAYERQLSYYASQDPLTGLANRRQLLEAMTQQLSSRRSRDRDAAVLFCDLDGFRQINDVLGHEAGDRVLIEVGERLLGTARDHDLVARIAGNEFVLLIRDIANLADAELAAVRQLDALTTPIFVAGTSVVVTASVGLALARDYESAAELLQAADRGMRDAKRAGGGRYRRYQPAESVN